jgi:class 3 adenylate cyclase
MTCPACGYANRDGAKFCSECGTPLAAPSAPAREERKVVSVLFCDLVGFTARSEALDPEDVRAVLGPYHARLRTELERYGGTVEKFIGDAVMAIFGAPVAHEDDPERAVRAALAIREAIAENEDLHVRIGVTTGEALVNLSARPDAGEGMAAGDVVNTAARLESNAPVDGILVDETTFRATERAIEYREHPPVEAKGKAEPVPAWEALAARSRLGLDVGEQTGTPLVGRRLELELLTSAFARARTERVAQLVTLVGVPGIGKSRLLLELFRRVDEDEELVRWRQGRCLPYGEGVALWALAEIVKAEAGVLDTDAAEEATAKLARTVADVVADAGEASWVERHLRALAGVDGGLELRGDRRDEAFAAWRRFFEGLAEQGPAVLVFEDLQWADETLLEFVDYLVDWVADVPLLVVATARPELLTTRPGWGGGKANAATHSLSPLTDEETASLVHAVLGRAVLPAEMQQSLLLNAGGNPLYAEEFARMLSERGAADGGLALPESVQGIIAARLDGLDPAEKALLQDAAVVGKVFWLGVLEALSGEERWRLERRLHELERRELVRRDRQSAVGGERQYAFRHLLVREVAYGQIPRARRADKHAAVAGWIEALSPDRSEDRADMLAHHWVAAARYAEAAGRERGELAGHAHRALVEAGDRALSLNAAPAAAGFYEQALSFAAEPPPSLLLRFGRSLYLAADPRAEDVVTRARDALAAAGDRSGEALSESMLGHLAWIGGDTRRARARTGRSVELARDLPASSTKARVLGQAASAAMVGGRYTETLDLGRETLALTEELGLDDVRANVLASIGAARANSGDDGGFEDFEEAIAIAAAARSPEASRAANNLGAALFERGDLAGNRQRLAEASRYAEAFGSPQMARFLRGNAPAAAYFAGDLAEAERLADAFLRETESSPHYQEATARNVRGQIFLARGEVAAAVAEAERAHELAEASDDPQAKEPELGLSARVFLAAGDVSRARLMATELLDAIERTEEGTPISLALVAPIAEELGLRERVAAALPPEKPRESLWLAAARALVEQRFVDAAETWSRMPFPLEEAQTRLLAARALVSEDRRAAADEQLHRALAFLRSVGAARYVREGEELLAAAS